MCTLHLVADSDSGICFTNKWMGMTCVIGCVMFFSEQVAGHDMSDR